MADYIYLNEDSKRVLEDLIQWWKGRNQNTTLRPRIEEPTVVTPDVYVALATSGIPARSGLIPGCADCLIYRKLSNVLVAVTGLSRRICNSGTTSIGAGAYPLVGKDKFGTWWVVGTACGTIGEPGTETGTIPPNLPSNITLTYDLSSCGGTCASSPSGELEMELTVPGEGSPFYSPVGGDFTPPGCSDPISITLQYFSSGGWILLMSIAGNAIATAGPVTPTENPFSWNFGSVDIHDADALCPGSMNILFEE